MKKGFTLIELLVVLALIAILAVILIVALQPQQIFMKARDAQRQGDLRVLVTSMEAIFAETIQGVPPLDNSNNGTCVIKNATPTIYFSVGGKGDGNSNTAELSTTSGITGATVNWTYSGTSSRAVDGTGWLPIDLTQYPVIAISQLPIDPANDASQNLYYTYACYSGTKGYHYEFNARLESSKAGETDGGDNTSLYERGSRLDILPVNIGSGFYQ